ncbi:MAG TPA: nuclear transport factor 2 family protein [Candidatus Dormibacteraeota bacterium]
MSAELIEMARPELEAWQRGDVDALAPLLDPEVELTGWEPGEWDCHGREAVLALLLERLSEGASAAEIELIDAGDEMIVATRTATVPDGPAASLRPATLITFREGKAVTKRQFRNRSEALAPADDRTAPEHRGEAAGGIRGRACDVCSPRSTRGAPGL